MAVAKAKTILETADEQDKKVRLNLELARDVHEQLQKIQAGTGAASLTEVIRRALSLYDVVVEHTTDGGKVVFRFPDGEEETLRLI
jgi:hypothetical protein